MAFKYKLLEKVGENLWDLGLDKEFLDVALKALSIKLKKQMEFHKK